jgi:polyferredoxin
MSWEEVAGMDLKKAGVEGVSGATMTSLAVAEGIVHRFRVAQGELRPPAVRVGARDFGLAAVVALGTCLTFTKRAGRERWRRRFQWVVIGYVGLLNGDLLAQSLLAGWAKSGVAWRMAPGLALLAAATFVVPWAANRPLYCQQLCPHGAAQEVLTRLAPTRWRVRVPASLDRALRWLPGGLLLLVLFVVMLPLDFDLAGLEPFDAYVIRSAGAATIAVAVIGLLAALCVPKAYCKYGCPTGALLEFVRARGAGDKFEPRDAAAGLLLGVALLLHWQHAAIHTFVFGPAA